MDFLVTMKKEWLTGKVCQEGRLEINEYKIGLKIVNMTAKP